MKSIGLWVITICAIAMCAPSWAQSSDEKPKPRILMFTHYKAFRHPSLPVAEKVFVELGRKSGVYEGVVLEGHKVHPDNVDLSALSAENLKNFDAVLFMTQGDLPVTPDQKKALVDFVKGGKGIIAAHCGADSFNSWKDYGEMIGGYFIRHGPNDKVLILKNEAPDHPATSMIGPHWPIADEIYQFGMTLEETPGDVAFSRSRVRVLLSADTKITDMAALSTRMNGGSMTPARDKDYPIAWCREYGKGRSFYTALGHREDVWQSALYQEHLLGGIKWALGLVDGDATPSAAGQ